MPGHAKSYIVGSKFLPAGTFSRFLLVERSANDFAWAPISPKLFTKPFEQQMTVIVKNVCRNRLVRTSTSLRLPTPWDGRSHFQLEALRAWKALVEHPGEEGGGWVSSLSELQIRESQPAELRMCKDSTTSPCKAGIMKLRTRTPIS